MESQESRLMQSIKELSDIEVQKLELQFAKFNREIVDDYEKKIKLIESNLNGKISFYGKKVEECQAEKDRIINKYIQEFQKIYDKRKEQFFNIQSEIQEIQANQKIALANFKKTCEEKREMLQSKDYVEYVSKKQRFENIVNSTLNHEEFDKYSKFLEELSDPQDTYINKMEALITKFDGYSVLISECENKLKECKIATLSDFSGISKYISTDLTVAKKENFIVSFINKVLNKIMNNSKFEKEVINKMEKELIEIEENNNNALNTINNQTINIIAKVEELRDAINNEFKLAIE